MTIHAQRIPNLYQKWQLFFNVSYMSSNLYQILFCTIYVAAYLIRVWMAAIIVVWIKYVAHTLYRFELATYMIQSWVTYLFQMGREWSRETVFFFFKLRKKEAGKSYVSVWWYMPPWLTSMLLRGASVTVITYNLPPVTVGGFYVHALSLRSCHASVAIYCQTNNGFSYSST